MFKEIQQHPIKNTISHIDLYEVSKTKVIEIEVPINLIGEPIGVKKDDGILEQRLRKLLVECLPGAIPKEIEVDISEMEVGHTRHVEDIVVPDGVQIKDSLGQPVVSVVAPGEIEEKVVEEELVEGEVGGEGEKVEEKASGE